MPEQLHVFISYRKHEGITPDYALQIAETLEKDHQFSVFIDKLRLKTADEWEKRIYAEIHRADVLVLLLEPGTASSDWVQREVDFARGAGVELLPLLMVDRAQVNLDDAMVRLALSSVQHSDLFRHTPEDYAKLATDIRRLALETRSVQRALHHQRENHWYRLPIELKLRHSSYKLRGGYLPDLRVHLTIGNILDMPPGTLDVLVDSENDYLQMARFTEIHTLSGRLRKAGALFLDGRLLEDTVQQDLNAYGDSRPVAPRQVIVTRAGHEKSELRSRKRLKLLFHAVTVQLNIGSILEPIYPVSSDEAIYEIITHCFERIQEINADDNFRHAIDPTFSVIECIGVPMFGTGAGERSLSQTSLAIVEGLFRVLDSIGKHDMFAPFTLREIHLLAYSDYDADIVQMALNQYFEGA